MVMTDKKKTRISSVSIVLVLYIACMLLLPLSSCKKKSEKDNAVRTEGQYGYASFYLDFPVKEGYTLFDIGDVFLDDDHYVVSVVYSHYDERTDERDYLTDILSIDETGQVIFTLEITKMQVVRAVFEEEYAFFAYADQDLLDVQNGKKNPTELCADLVFFSKKTGETTRVIHPGMKSDTVFSIPDGFVVAGENRLEKYSSDGILKSSIQTAFTLYQSATTIFESGGSLYLLTSSDEWDYDYYKLDFSSSQAEYVIGAESLGDDVETCSGPYFFSPYGEYKVNLDKMQIQTLALWNEIDIRPTKMSDSEQQFIALDDTHFAVKNIYMDGTGDIGFFVYDNSLNVGRTKIVIGGYEAFADEPLQWAIYNFNTKNDKYRIVVEDYSKDFSYLTPQEAQTAKLKLLKYFNEGNSPDIFYGEKFDYEYFGRSGMVMDLIPFFDKDSQLDLSDLLPGVKKSLTPDGEHCYSVFSSFHLSGYYGLKSDFPNNQVSLSDIQNMSKEADRPITSAQSAPCIAVESLSYNFYQYWGAYEENKTISADEVERFVSTVIDLGIDPSVSWGSICSLQEVHNRQYYLASYGPTDLFELAREERNIHDRITYIGFPSLEGSVHLIHPKGLVGISSSSKYPEQCWEFIRELLLPKTQKKAAMSHSIPVNSDVLELMCRSAGDPDSVSDEDMKQFVKGHTKVAPEVIEDYIEIVNSVDTICAIDWGAYNIISEEISSYYTQKRTVKQIAETLDARLTLYVEENYH